MNTPMSLHANHVLTALPAQEHSLLASLLSSRWLKPGEALCTTECHPALLYFPREALISIRAEHRGRCIEVGVVGVEGVAGAFVALNCNSSPYSLVAANAGAAEVADVATVMGVLGQLPTLRSHIEAQIHREMRMLAEAAVVHATSSLSDRLALWLDDRFARTSQSEIRITHAELAALLGVRRAGVTVALHDFEGMKAIRSRRGRVQVLNREALRQHVRHSA